MASIQQLFKARLERDGLTRILSASTCIKRARSLGDADVFKFALESGDYVLLKSYRGRCWFIRHCLAGVFLHHEEDILHLLQESGCTRAPHPYGVIEGDTIAMEYFTDAVALKGAKHYTVEDKPPRAFFQELVQCIRSMHEAGIAHGDLRRGNVMIDLENHVRIIDVATSCQGGRTGSWLGAMLFKMFQKSDNYSLAKIVRSYYPDMIDEELSRYLREAPWYLKLGRFLRQKIYRPLRGKH